MGMYCHVQAVNPADVQQIVADPELALGQAVHLEKAWHGLHYLLTGSAWEGEMPLGFLLQGGEPIGEDLGYGPPRYFSPDEVRQVDSALYQVSDGQLWARFDAEQLTAEEIYPGVWDEPEDQLREEYVGYFQELKRLVSAAAAGGKGLLVVVS